MSTHTINTASMLTVNRRIILLRVIWTRDRPKFGFSFGFGAETDLKWFLFGYGYNTPFHIQFRPQLYGRRPKLAETGVSELMKDIEWDYIDCIGKRIWG